MPEDPGPQLDPNWSPDGSRLVFGGESNNVRSAIHILDLPSTTTTDCPALPSTARCRLNITADLWKPAGSL